MKCLLTLLLLLGSLLGSSQSVRFIARYCAKKSTSDTSSLNWKACNILVVVEDSSVCIHSKDSLRIYITGKDSIVDDKLVNTVRGYFTGEDQYGIDCSIMTFDFGGGDGGIAIKYPDTMFVYKFKREELQ